MAFSENRLKIVKKEMRALLNRLGENARNMLKT